MAKLAFLGTGLMGSGMAGRLLDAGHEMRIYNRTVKKTIPLIKAGATLAMTPCEAAQGADAVLSMVADNEASEDVWLGANGALSATLAADAVCVECSTLSHDWVATLSKAVRAEGHIYIDSPVTGYPHMAAAGEITLFVGADKNDLATAQPLLEPLCKEIIHFGDVGTGTAYKLIVNLIGAVQIAAAAEGMAIAERAGLNRTTVAGALSKGAAASPQVIRNVERMARGEHETNISFSGRLRLKDASYGLALAKAVGQQADIGQVAADTFSRQIEQGFGELSESKVIDVIARLEKENP